MNSDPLDEAPTLSAAQRQELDRRLADDEAYPNDGSDWSELKRLALARIAQIRVEKSLFD